VEAHDLLYDLFQDSIIGPIGAGIFLFITERAKLS